MPDAKIDAINLVQQYGQAIRNLAEHGDPMQKAMAQIILENAGEL
jgi:hypothetical protein